MRPELTAHSIVCFVFAAVLAASASPSRAAPSAGSGVGAWEEVAGGPGALCAQGTPFSFFVHAGNPRRLLFFIGGGGACWSVETCVEQPMFDASVDSTDYPRSGGILDFSRTENPFRAYSAVLVPYCTGDVHLGTHVVTYAPADSGGAQRASVGIRHTGAANVRSALDWVYRTVRDPETIVVVGASAGGIASPYYADVLARHYPRARVVQLGDGAGGYRAPRVPELMATWGVTDLIRGDSTYSPVDSAAMTFEALYTHAGHGHSRVRFSQINSTEDGTQLRFLGLIGVSGVPLRSLLAQNHAEIRRAIPGFRAYTAPGSAHTVIGSAQFYTLSVDGEPLRDWVAALSEGRPVKNVGEDVPQTK